MLGGIFISIVVTLHARTLSAKGGPLRLYITSATVVQLLDIPSGIPPEWRVLNQSRNNHTAPVKGAQASFSSAGPMSNCRGKIANASFVLGNFLCMNFLPN